MGQGVSPRSKCLDPHVEPAAQRLRWQRHMKNALLHFLLSMSLVALGSVAGCDGSDSTTCTPGQAAAGNPCSNDDDCASCICMSGEGYKYCASPAD